MENQTEPQYLTSLQWGLIMALCWKDTEFKDEFEKHPRVAIEKFKDKFPPGAFPEDMTQVRVLRIPPNPGDIPNIQAIASGDEPAIALPYTCLC
ncbi:hypothetical protein [Laspinema palackyanum]|uniref:hypothetical protein n=1 Tax=Laspinema palackyanum TaxID=3231601 RepID=UPI00345C7FA6|nr:hypothetical protein [Laspinema sp. D2c]